MDLKTCISKLEAMLAAPQYLPGSDGHPPAWHLWKANEVDALSIALAAQRPLLVRGEPGTGKSQLARAASAALGWELHSCALHARSEPQDLLYQFDAVRRLADAQIGKLDETQNSYWQPQALWHALDWESAQEFGAQALRVEGAAPAGHVVLIDEIDKAPSDVPNGLLELLSARFFEIPALGRRVPEVPGKNPWPLLIITTNEERELPPAFLRRCMVLSHDLPQGAAYADFLLAHGQVHFGAGRTLPNGRQAGAGDSLSDAAMRQAAQQMLQDRQQAQMAQLNAPGLAEYLDLLAALHQLAAGDDEAQRTWLARLNQYAFLKNRIEEGGDDDLRQVNGARHPPALDDGAA